jgi:hypothetical protein
MSFLDLDEWLLELAARADLVFSPFLDTKEFPEGVDISLVEGAVANEDHEHLVRLVRSRSRMLVALFGDCAVLDYRRPNRRRTGRVKTVGMANRVESFFDEPVIDFLDLVAPLVARQECVKAVEYLGVIPLLLSHRIDIENGRSLPIRR